MLPAAQRLTRKEEFSRTIRQGGRGSGRGTIAHVARVGDAGTRVGLIVGRNVGGAVKRNLVKRRLRAIAAVEIQSGRLDGCAVVVRALPAAESMSFSELERSVDRCLRRALERTGA